jgi:hypothetical protein
MSIKKYLPRAEKSNPRRPHHGGRPKKPVVIGGFEWPSIADAARALDYDHRNLAKVLKKPKDSVAWANLMATVEKYKAAQTRKPCR